VKHRVTTPSFSPGMFFAFSIVSLGGFTFLLHGSKTLELKSTLQIRNVKQVKHFYTECEEDFDSFLGTIILAILCLILV
jgi:hypothetical protein